MAELRVGVRSKHYEVMTVIKEIVAVFKNQ
jgi:hypothetical protein